MMNLRLRAYLFDLDGTLAHMGDRGPFEWNKVEQDTLNEPVANLAMALNMAGWHVIYCSGRMEAARGGTMRWLARNGLARWKLFMRADGDFRKDNVVKKEIYLEQIEPFYEIIAVIDDRRQVVDMWRKDLGLPCFQVAEGDF